MMKAVKVLLFTLSVGVMGLCGAVPAAAVYAAAPTGSSAVNEACNGIGLAGGGCGDNGAQLNKAIDTAIEILTIVVGIVAVVMVIIGGLTYITSNGESPKVAKAKTSLIYALVGLIIVALAQSIVHFVLGKATGK
jgi:hypothetical protein